MPPTKSEKPKEEKSIMSVINEEGSRQRPSTKPVAPKNTYKYIVLLVDLERRRDKT